MSGKSRQRKPKALEERLNERTESKNRPEKKTKTKRNFFLASAGALLLGISSYFGVNAHYDGKLEARYAHCFRSISGGSVCFWH